MILRDNSLSGPCLALRRAALRTLAAGALLATLAAAQGTAEPPAKKQAAPRSGYEYLERFLGGLSASGAHR